MSTITYIQKGFKLADLSTAARVAVDNLIDSRSLSYACYNGIAATARYTKIDGHPAIKVEEEAIHG